VHRRRKPPRRPGAHGKSPRTVIEGRPDDALSDLKNDPFEMTNLLSAKPLPRPAQAAMQEMRDIFRTRYSQRARV